MNKKFLKNIIIFLGVIVIIVFLSYLRKYLNDTTIDYLKHNGTFAQNVEEDNELLLEFKKRFRDREVILACSEDINDDSNKDLVVISKINDNIETIVLLDIGNNDYLTTEPIPAPRENQFIKFFNMDKSGAIEVLITGEKKGQVGYAIYRYENGHLIDIFGEGMEDCC